MAQQSGGVTSVAPQTPQRDQGGTGTIDLSRLFQSHPVATLVLEPNGTIIDANQAAEQLFNRSRAGLIGNAVEHALRWNPGGDLIAALASPAKSIWAFSVNLARDGDETMIADIALGPSTGDDDWRIMAIHPVPRGGRTPFRRPGSAARSAGAAAAMLAHEVKNPLSGIRGAAQLLGKAQQQAEPGALSALIVREVDRIAALIDGMQAFTQGAPLVCGPINIYLPIAQARVVSQQGFCAQKPISEEFDPSLPLAHGNHDALVQILLNLLKNAAEALGDQGDGAIRLTTAYRHGLSWDADDGRGQRPLPIEIAVADNGPGVPEMIADSLFDPFVTGKRDGQGLGLALVDKLARDMGGIIQHDRVGGWTRFRLHLPVASPDAGMGNRP